MLFTQFRIFVFQLHHTGIKTGLIYFYSYLEYHFNCTIQELKPTKSVLVSIFNIYFNCTIQELKLIWLIASTALFANFNCTIQELKQVLLSSF